MPVLAFKNGTLIAVRHTFNALTESEKDGKITVRDLEGHNYVVRKSDTDRALFDNMSDALAFAGADADWVQHHKDLESAEANVNADAPVIRQASYVKRYPIPDDCRGGGTESAVCNNLSEKYARGREFLTKQIARRTKSDEVVAKTTFFDALRVGGIYGVVYEVSVHVEFRKKLTIVK